MLCRSIFLFSLTTILIYFLTAAKRVTRATVSRLQQTGSTFTTIDLDGSESDFPKPSMISEHIKSEKKKKTTSKGRDSLSSVSISINDNESSGYSTPGTSAVATPAALPKSMIAKRGRRSTTRMEIAAHAADAVARAAALRNSAFSMNPHLKRKRVVD
jgi:DNA repair protein RAD16